MGPTPACSQPCMAAPVRPSSQSVVHLMWPLQLLEFLEPTRMLHSLEAEACESWLTCL